MSPYDDVANDYKCSLFKLDDLKKKKIHLHGQVTGPPSFQLIFELKKKKEKAYLA